MSRLTSVGLARTGWSDDSDSLAGFSLDVHIFNEQLVGFVTEINMLELDRAAWSGQHLGIDRIGDLLGLVE